MSEPITFGSEGTALRGRLYRGKGAGPRPAVVMAHGFTAVAAQLEPQANALADAGFTVLAFDHAGFGLSDGYPRQEPDPPRQLRGYRDALSVTRTLPDVRADRIGLWGSSYSGGLVLQATAVDPRVACVVSQAPFVSGSQLLRLRPDYDEFMAALYAERESRAAGNPPTLIPAVAEREEDPCALPGRDGWDWFTGTGGPTWKNEVTLSAFELARSFEPGWYIAQIAPRPLLMLIATQDTVTPTEHALEAFERAGEPKKKLMIEGGHFAVYEGRGFEQAMSATLDWFGRHLA